MAERPVPDLVSAAESEGPLSSLAETVSLGDDLPIPDDWSGGDVGSQWPLVDRTQLQSDLKSQNFDKIRFATYRTACKLRFIQKKVYFHMVDIYNVIEAFRENNLHGNALHLEAEVSAGKLETTLSTVYYYLNKRLPSTHQLNVEHALTLLLGWVMSAFDPEHTGRIKVISIKVALSTLCAGKYVDKLKYVFENLVSEGAKSEGSVLSRTKFDAYLQHVLTLPTAVHEGPSFGYDPASSLKSCFPQLDSVGPGSSKVTMNEYLDTMFGDPGPQCLLWLPLMHRMANVENVLHPVPCSFCQAQSMMGFRYKCQRCASYQLCQNCFWNGHANGPHANHHEMKEYSTYKSPAKQFTHTLRKGTMKCLPTSTAAAAPGPAKQDAPYESETTLNLQHIIPPNPGGAGYPHQASDLQYHTMGSSPRDPALLSHFDRLTEKIDETKLDDEHRLIARYAAKIAQETLNSLSGRPNAAAASQSNVTAALENNKSQRQREMLADLHQRNRDIMREIARLKEERDETSRISFAHSNNPGSRNNPSLVMELRSLRQRKDELEHRMASLQESRRELMVQLESLMKMLRMNQSQTSGGVYQSQTLNTTSVASSKLNGSLVHPSSIPSSAGGGYQPPSSAAAQFNPGYRPPGNTNNLHAELLIAADHTTQAAVNLLSKLSLGDESGMMGYPQGGSPSNPAPGMDHIYSTVGAGGGQGGPIGGQEMYMPQQSGMVGGPGSAFYP